MNTNMNFSPKNHGYIRFIMKRIKNQKKIIYCDLRPNHTFLRKSRKTKKLKCIKSDRVCIKYVIHKNVTQRAIFYRRTVKINKTKIFVYIRIKLQFYTEYHKNNKTQIFERSNMNTKMIFSQKYLEYTSLNIQRLKNHKQMFTVI